MNAVDTPESNVRERDDSRWAVLSTLRLFLAMIVVLGHCCSLVGGPADWTHVGLWLNQGSAVFGFFMISGYSIAASLDKSTRGFYRRRILRIWPLYVSCIAAGLLVSLRIPHGLVWPSGEPLPPPSVASVIASLVMLQGIAAPSLPIVGQIWSLGPEWWHYVAAPYLCRISTPVLMILLAISFAAFLQIPTPSGRGAEGFTHGLALLTLSWLWMTGFVYFRSTRHPSGLAVLLIPSASAFGLGHFTGVPLFITIVVLLFSIRTRLSKRCQERLLILGDISFPLYLFHIPTMALVFTFGVKSTAWMVIASLLTAIVALYGIDYSSRRGFSLKSVRSRDVALGAL